MGTPRVGSRCAADSAGRVQVCDTLHEQGRCGGGKERTQPGDAEEGRLQGAMYGWLLLVSLARSTSMRKSHVTGGLL